jgi:glycosyltransferase involved in cell wall biosynthesis
MIKFSIIIPTADRHYLLQHTLRACLAVKRADIEVIVSDNFSSPETKSAVDAHLSDGRLRYFRTDRRLPMPEHWDFAWAKARGRFVIINCDDDSLSETGLRVIDRAIDQFDPHLLSWHVALYHHPDYDLEGPANTVVFPSGHSDLCCLLDCGRVIAEYGKFNFRYFPEGTHFCLKRELGDHIIKATGRLFWPPPDFAAPLLALAASNDGRYCYIDSVLGFGGRSLQSNAAGFVKRKDSDNSKRMRQFHSEFKDDDSRFPFHDLRAPFYYNYHLSAIPILKKFYPEFAGLEVDMFKFFSWAYEELFGMRHNPLVDNSMERHLDDYIDTMGPDARSTAICARREVLQRRNPWSPRDPNLFVRRVTPTFIKEGFKRFLVRSNLITTTTSVVRISGAEYGFANGFDLFTNWDQIVGNHDLRSLANISEAFSKDLVLSAHRLRNA